MLNLNNNKNIFAFETNNMFNKFESQNNMFSN